MSMKAAAYQSYLNTWKANHPGVVEPITFTDYDTAMAMLRHATSGRFGVKLLTKSMKFWSCWGVNEGAYHMADGAGKGPVYEISFTNSALQCPIVAVWRSKEEYDTYDQPMSYRVYHEEW